MDCDQTKKRRGNWTQEALEQAIEAVSMKRMSDYKASEQYGIPRRTIRRYIEANSSHKAKLGRKFALTNEQQDELCSRIVRLAEIGYPLTMKILRLCVYKYCVTNQIKHQFSDIKKIASYKWARKFLTANPKISLRKAQNLNPARAQKLNSFIVKDHFKTLQSLLKRNDLFGKPERVFNMDEKGCRLNLHKEPKVLAKKGARRVHIIGNEHGENVTVVACANALGYTIPPMILYKGKRMKPEFLDDLPPGSICSMTERGSMTATTFVHWVNHFGNHKPPGKCIVIFDGAKSHLDYDIVDAADRHNILLYCLPSNTTHELQPLDKAVFRSFEYHWDQEVQLYWHNHGERVLTKQRFGKIFSKVWDKCMTPSNIKSGFKACGIFPFDPSVIPEEAFAPSTATDLPYPEPVTTSTPKSQKTLSLSPQPGPSGLCARRDVHILPVEDEDPVEIEILDDILDQQDSNSESGTSFHELIPTPIKKATKIINRKPAINSRGVLLKKNLFSVTKKTGVLAHSSKAPVRPSNAPEPSSKVPTRPSRPPKRSAREAKPVIKGKKNKDSWFCEVCEEDSLKDMRMCHLCAKYVHEECVGLTKNDKELFICPNCEE